MPWTDLDTLFGLLRPCVTGEALAAFFAGISVDVRSDLAHIAVPTLVIHSTDNEVIRFAHAQYLAALVALHEAMRGLAVGGNETVCGVLERLGLASVSV